MEQQTIDRYFQGRRLVLATRHGKEAVLRPLLEPALGVKLEVPEAFDSDAFGTFSGEVERAGGALEAARRKCDAAHGQTGADLVLASEGSFGGHPVIGFVPAAEELLLLKDYRFGYELRARVISTKTNFSGNEYYDWDDLLYFTAQAGFPAHALILRPAKDDCADLRKGIHDWEELRASFDHIHNLYGKVWVETDMRAFHNPTRMKVIAEAGEKLLSVIASACPLCGGPGFDVREVLRGLPCSQCATPTRSPRALVHACPHCAHTETRPASDRKAQEDPMFCDTCNP